MESDCQTLKPIITLDNQFIVFMGVGLNQYKIDIYL